MVAVTGNRRPIAYGIYAVLALLLLAAIFQASGGSTSAIREHASWAYLSKPTSPYQEHAAEKHTPYDDDVYDDEAASNSTGKSPGPSSALADAEELGNAYISPNMYHEGNGNGKWAFATFLATKEDDQPDDPYFTACRTLVYQLLHHPKTKTNNNIPLLILTPPHAHKRKLDMLTDEGAKVIKVEQMGVEPDFMDGVSGTRASVVFSRLRMWEMKEYTRILYVDAATLLLKPIDDIFREALVGGDMRALGKIEAQNGFDNMEGEKPGRYFMAGVADTKSSKHEFPPRDEGWMSPGFYMLQPDAKVFKYYQSILKHLESFESNRLMAGLLNHAHRKDGPMPWSTFEPGKWNVNYPGTQDLKGGVATLHTKFWDANNRSWLDRSLVEMWWRIQGQMEGFWFRRGYGAPKVFE